MAKSIFITILSITSLMSCISPKIAIDNLEILPLENIPGASGMGISNEGIYIAGDNSPYLYILDHRGNQLSKHLIYPDHDFANGEIPKILKPDFEALEVIKGDPYDTILIFGSGSKSPKRDIMVRVVLADNPRVNTYSLVGFYDQLRNLPIMQGHELNIEAVAHYDQRLLLFNRGKNLMLDFNHTEFLMAIEGNYPVPDPIIHEVQLPSLGGLASGFSGATVIPNSRTLLFTTSIEDTPNAYDDGEVLGSFIGLMDLENPNEIQYILLEEQEKAMPLKVESISVQSMINDTSANILMVTDSDGAESLLIKAVIRWSPTLKIIKD